MRRSTKIAALLLFSSSVWYSCSTDVEGKNAVIQQKNSDLQQIFTVYGLFGAGIGDSLHVVKNKFGIPTSTKGGELIYEGEVDGMDRTLYLNFDEGMLYEITLDLFPKDSLRLYKIFDMLQGLMDERFQQSRPAPGYATWRAASPTGRLIEVTMSDESVEYGAPLIMLNLIENYDRTFQGE